MNVKSKINPRVGTEGPQGEKMYSSALSLISSLNGVRDQRHAPASFLQRKGPDTNSTVGWFGLQGRSKRYSIPGPSIP
jgi:hypothetical protein